MGFLFLLNFVLIAIPIGSTLGALLGIQAHRSATGQEPLFKNPGTGNTPKKGDNRVNVTAYCNETIGISPLSQGDHYTLNPNPWGWDKGDNGSICLNVKTWNNQSYPTEHSAPEWWVTWEFPQGPESQPVHAFPNVKVDSGVFPSAIKNIKNISLDFEWTYAVGNTTALVATDVKKLNATNVNANVALDIFLDEDKEKSLSSEDASTEIMVWFAAFGPATQTIGMSDGIEDTQTLGDTEFHLYTGKNGNGQTVLTWYSPTPANHFHEDLQPLVDRLVEMGKTGYPKSSDYIGYLSLGTETYSSDQVVTFHVPELAINVQTK